MATRETELGTMSNEAYGQKKSWRGTVTESAKKQLRETDRLDHEDEVNVSLL